MAVSNHGRARAGKSENYDRAARRRDFTLRELTRESAEREAESKRIRVREHTMAPPSGLVGTPPESGACDLDGQRDLQSELLGRSFTPVGGTRRAALGCDLTLTTISFAWGPCYRRLARFVSIETKLESRSTPSRMRRWESAMR